jgi:hypothetical protein
MEQIRINVLLLANRTTEVELRDGKRIFGGKEDKSPHARTKPLFLEITETGFKLCIPPRTCSQGHRLELELELVSPPKVMRFRAQGVVRGAEVHPNDHDCIEIELTQFDDTVWQLIQGAFRGQQSRVTELFERLRGTG